MALARSELRELPPGYKLSFLSDLLGEKEGTQPPLSELELSQAEQMLGVLARNFVGNLYSSFSRTIIEMRQIEGKPVVTL